MEYAVITILLFAAMLVYFRLADRFNIIDKPNHRSAHTEITLRGGGIIFPLAFLAFLGRQISVGDSAKGVIPLADLLIFGLGLVLICFISFMDDVRDVSTKARLLFHFVAVTLLLYFTGAFSLLPLWAIPVCYILVIGILNAYNFMDGINGMSGLFSLIVLGSLFFVNDKIIAFVPADFIIYPMIACLVFLFFNFRKKAKCFMGDIGSLGIAFWILALLGLLMLRTGEVKWILFLVVYGVETILTIIERLKLRENIFDAHRRHLYQLFANEKRVSHLLVSAVYSGIQLLINIFVISSDLSDGMMFLVILLPAMAFYIFIKVIIKNNISSKI